MPEWLFFVHRDPVGEVVKAITGEWSWTISDVFELQKRLTEIIDHSKKEIEATGQNIWDHMEDEIGKYK